MGLLNSPGVNYRIYNFLWFEWKVRCKCSQCQGVGNGKR